ncbi:MAG TPA: MOSC domain-containing protein [Anaerolineales bacterium]
MSLNNPTMGERVGWIFQINASNGGVPKLSRKLGEVTFNGLTGDNQANLDVHGGPERALCLYSLERILALQAEGHPIFPGSAGENLTLAGLDWSLVNPGTRLQLGASVLVQVTRYTSPCNTISGSFMKNDYSRISQKVFPGWSRVYAQVIQPGTIQVSDAVRISTMD